ncbi:hypothetical protein PR002_g22807 [Phytophthora rubi]|uniref:Uncharacterized protein n=1 Tax=Phytophthora rubi TaxID=129364 RepID=A0A6A3IZN6_9STRA|nr:hypothetical protein PR002_g22807 [Phytophthora rubi]
MAPAAGPEGCEDARLKSAAALTLGVEVVFALPYPP